MERDATLGHALGHHARGGRVEPETFADDGLEVRELHRFGVGDGRGDPALGDGGVDLVPEGREDAGVGDDLEDREPDGVGG